MVLLRKPIRSTNGVRKETYQVPIKLMGQERSVSIKMVFLWKPIRSTTLQKRIRSPNGLPIETYQASMVFLRKPISSTNGVRKETYQYQVPNGLPMETY